MDEPKGIEKICLIIDFHNSGGMGSIGELKIATEVATILQNHYPGTLKTHRRVVFIFLERLGHSFIVNAPWMFSFFWKVSL